MRTRWGGAAVLAIVVFALLGSKAARWLIVDQPAKSDAILVLAGETDARPRLGLKLLDAGYAPVMVLDVPAEQRVYEWTQSQLAQSWISTLPEAGRITICPIRGLSTKAEAHEAEACLNKGATRRVLLVTSDFHTRRALSTFRHELPAILFSVAAAAGGQEFGPQWWKHREWAKTTFYEWLRLGWWELVDRWR